MEKEYKDLRKNPGSKSKDEVDKLGHYVKLMQKWDVID